MSHIIDLSGKVALITGASQGIGVRMARTLHGAGATVVLNHPDIGTTAADAQHVADELNAIRPNSADVVAGNVGDPQAVQYMMAKVQQQRGGLDILINNAAIIRDRTVAKMSLEEWHAVIEVNLSGVFHCCKFGLENCLSCHNPEKAKGDLDMSDEYKALTTGENAPSLVPFDPKNSAVFTLTSLAADHDDLMPPSKSGGPLKKDQIELIRAWIEQGAAWPDKISLKAKEKKAVATNNPDNMELVKKIHALIVQTSKEKGEGEMQNYDTKVPKTGIPFSMVAIKGGEYLMGSPASEAKRKDDEGPQVKVKVKPFWIGKCEVTWDEYNPFMITDVGRNKDGSRQKFDPADPISDIVSQPTTPYTEMSFGMGTDGYPAISMTHHAANKYCQWLSAQTGHFYRLPTEQEWEYAARAGTTTAYWWGDDASKVKDNEWFYDNAPNFAYAKVGQKPANPWGLHDVLGNVAEWTLDQYQPDYYKNLAALGDKALNYYVPSTKPYPHTARGGSWDDDPEKLRASARRGSNPDWKQQDPQLPKSIWYLTDAKFLGMRLVRPLEIPTPEEMFKYWNNGVEKE